MSCTDFNASFPKNGKVLDIPQVEITDVTNFITVAETLATKGAAAKVDQVNWAEYPYAPEVEISVAHTGSHLWTLFSVTEGHLLANALEPNGDVWLDCCCEIFIGDRDGKHYYNFETNCIGTNLAARRLSAKDFEFIPEADHQKVICLSTLPHEEINLKGSQFNWQLAVGIPFEIMGLDGTPEELRINFYKCGDNTEKPHFLSWSPIDLPSPAFHCPEFFGKVILK